MGATGGERWWSGLKSERTSEISLSPTLECMGGGSPRQGPIWGCPVRPSRFYVEPTCLGGDVDKPVGYEPRL